ncbi:MAG: hypothetical protein PVG32_20765 [Anaerolineales bacterium]
MRNEEELGFEQWAEAVPEKGARDPCGSLLTTVWRCIYTIWPGRTALPLEKK